MESIKLSLFDIFAYTLPGLFILIGIIMLADESVTSIIYLTKILNSIGFGTGIVAVLTAYVIGFAIDSPASIYYNISCKIGENPKEDSLKIFKMDRRKKHELLQIIRDKSPNINVLLQTWKLLKTMSHNLAFTFLLLTFITLVKPIFYTVDNSTEWYLLGSGCLILSLILSRRAKIFDWWFFQDLFNAGIALKIKYSDNVTEEIKDLVPNKSKKLKTLNSEKQ